MSSAILWFRRDLRLSDNSALHAALVNCVRLLPVYIKSLPGNPAPPVAGGSTGVSPNWTGRCVGSVRG